MTWFSGVLGVLADPWRLGVCVLRVWGLGFGVQCLTAMDLVGGRTIAISFVLYPLERTRNLMYTVDGQNPALPIIRNIP